MKKYRISLILTFFISSLLLWPASGSSTEARGKEAIEQILAPWTGDFDEMVERRTIGQMSQN